MLSILMMFWTLLFNRSWSWDKKKEKEEEEEEKENLNNWS